MLRTMKTRDELMQELVSIQNLPENWGRDIVTFSGFCNDQELAEHIERNK